MYGVYGCRDCHNGLTLLQAHSVCCESVDVNRCRHCYRELLDRLQSSSSSSAVVTPSLPQAWTIRGDYIGGLLELCDWLLVRNSRGEQASPGPRGSPPPSKGKLHIQRGLTVVEGDRRTDGRIVPDGLTQRGPGSGEIRGVW